MALRQGAPQHGAFVVSLDLELHWGVRDKEGPGGPYRPNLLGARSAIPRILKLFERYEISATWATVGFLFARNRDELEGFFPAERPRYRHSRFDPYGEEIGCNESADPLHFGRSLLTMIMETPGQEVGSHTFSHYYCLEEGQDAAAFRADLASAQRIADATVGIPLKSLVLPRNQFNPEYAAIVRDAGFLCYRGNQPGRIYRAAGAEGADAMPLRAARLVDAYVPGLPDRLQSWNHVWEDPGLANIRASRFLRPCNPGLAVMDDLRASRIKRAMRKAARNRQLYHLWWHPHNCGAHIDESIEFLSRILKEARNLKDEYGFRSLSMAEAAMGGMVSCAPIFNCRCASEGRPVSNLTHMPVAN